MLEDLTSYSDTPSCLEFDLDIGSDCILCLHVTLGDAGESAPCLLDIINDRRRDWSRVGFALELYRDRHCDARAARRRSPGQGGSASRARTRSGQLIELELISKTGESDHH
ncbi:hypothetical protein EVAR_65586_1 [Eumeta japonica]|uniref:Uncharacterized protein n=1 Tax=Eumeta variegata TaxID=151549 RepID=A0A4C1Z360_EUMVA|nr:hypothetical protein EVAR_65586_1 [Eumeta japonica]